MIDHVLSEQGMKRRQQILLLAQTEARRRRKRRVAVRAGTCGIVVALAVISFVPHDHPKPAPQRQAIANIASASPASIAIEYLQTDPTITDRFTIQVQPPTWTVIDDHELLRDLAAAGQPAGIVCLNGKTILLPR